MLYIQYIINARGTIHKIKPIRKKINLKMSYDNYFINIMSNIFLPVWNQMCAHVNTHFPWERVYDGRRHAVNSMQMPSRTGLIYYGDWPSRARPDENLSLFNTQRVFLPRSSRFMITIGGVIGALFLLSEIRVAHHAAVRPWASWLPAMYICDLRKTLP